jgi:hypothetical protein
MATDPESLDERMLDVGAQIADRLYASVHGEWRAAVAQGCAMFAALLIVEQVPHAPDENPHELARQDMARAQVFVDEMLKCIHALRIENPYAKVH